MTSSEIVGTHSALHRSDRATRDELVLEHLPVVNAIARNLASRLPSSVDAGDVYGAGIAGLIDAAERLDVNREVRFRTYAEVRVRGAIRDYLRSLSWAPRRVHSRVRELARAKQAIEESNGRSGTAPELAQAMGMTLDQYHALMLEINAIDIHSGDELWNDEVEGRLNTCVADRADDPSAEMERK